MKVECKEFWLQNIAGLQNSSRKEILEFINKIGPDGIISITEIARDNQYKVSVWYHNTE